MKITGPVRKEGKRGAASGQVSTEEDLILPVMMMVTGFEICEQAGLNCVDFHSGGGKGSGHSRRDLVCPLEGTMGQAKVKRQLDCDC